MWPFNGGLQRAFSGTAGELLVRKKKRMYQLPCFGKGNATESA